MLTKEPSFASLLVKQSPAMHYGHGWITGEDGKRLNGLNHIAELRAKVFGLNIESELERFIKDMRDPRDINNEQNKRALAAIFFTSVKGNHSAWLKPTHC